MTHLRAARETLLERLFAPVDIAPLVWFRILFGGLIAWEVVRYFQLGRIDEGFVAPSFHFHYYGFDWVAPWPGSWMRLHFAATGILAAAVALGAAYRVTAPLLFIAFTYIFLIDQAFYLNHFYLVCLFAGLLILVPAHRACSIDAWRRPQFRSATAPAWAIALLQAQIGIVYFMGGVAKINGDWLSGEPMRMWLMERPALPLIGPYVTTAWAPYAFSYGGLAVDLALPVLLLWRRTRWFGLIVAALFHLANSRLFSIGIFPPLALGATLTLFAADLLPRPFAVLWAAVDAEPRPAPRSAWRRLVAVGLMVAWCVVQVLVPLRHLAYPGNPEWTEEGHRFSWRMKLRDKDGHLRLLARNPISGDGWEIDVSSYLTAGQIDEAATRPDMILQLAHHVSAEWAAVHGAPLEIYADAWASLNGRRRQVLIDPAVNLAAEPRSLRAARWIVPLRKVEGGSEK